jgi:hypothetical protein
MFQSFGCRCRQPEVVGQGQRHRLEVVLRVEGPTRDPDVKLLFSRTNRVRAGPAIAAELLYAGVNSVILKKPFYFKLQNKLS